MSAGELAGRGALVTGAGRGIGERTALRLAAAGARVVVAARSAGELDAVAARIRAVGGEACPVPTDLARPDEIERLAERAVAVLGAVDLLINNAGIAISAPVKAITLDDWQRMFAVNVTAAMLTTRALLPPMAERGYGRIVNVASIAARTGAAYTAAYAATKHALLGFTRSAAVEVAARGVTVNAVCPSYVATPMTDGSIARVVAKTGLSSAEALRRIVATNPQGRLIEADEVAFVIEMLCHPLARGINGQAIGIDGGALVA